MAQGAGKSDKGSSYSNLKHLWSSVPYLVGYRPHLHCFQLPRARPRSSCNWTGCVLILADTPVYRSSADLKAPWKFDGFMCFLNLNPFRSLLLISFAVHRWSLYREVAYIWNRYVHGKEDNIIRTSLINETNIALPWRQSPLQPYMK